MAPSDRIPPPVPSCSIDSPPPPLSAPCLSPNLKLGRDRVDRARQEHGPGEDRDASPAAEEAHDESKFFLFFSFFFDEFLREETR